MIDDYDYNAVNGTDGEYTSDSFSSVIGLYDHDAASEADGDIGKSRGDLPRGFGPSGSSPNSVEKERRIYERTNTQRM